MRFGLCTPIVQLHVIPRAPAGTPSSLTQPQLTDVLRATYCAAEKSRPPTDDNRLAGEHHDARMVLLIASVTIGLWLAVAGVATGVALVISRVLDAIDGVDDDGDGGQGRPQEPEPPIGGGEPDWWPEFESELADYAASRG